MAVVSMDLNIVEDIDGSPGARIANETVEVGESFFVQITAREHDAGFSGLQRVAVNLAWDPSVLEEIDAQFNPATLITPNLPTFLTGTLDNQAGTIWNLGGSSFSAWGVGRPIGSDGDDRFVMSHLQGYATPDDHFAWLHFRALAETDASALTLRQGGSRIATMPVSSLGSAQLDLETQTITVTARPLDADPIIVSPQIRVSSATSSGAVSIQFTTPIMESGRITEVPLVRPAFVDDAKFIDVTNTGDAPLTIYEVQVNAPDVAVRDAPTSRDDVSIVVRPGRTERLQLTYAPSAPSAADASVQSFDIADGVVILSNAANAPVVAVGLRGDSTFDADTNYDGRVDLADLILFDANYGVAAGDDAYRGQIDPNGDGVIDVGDLRPFAAHFHRSRDVPVVGAIRSFSRTTAEGEGQANGDPVSNVCVAAPGHNTVSSSAPATSTSARHASVRSASFIGPLLPQEHATRLILADSANGLMSDSNASQLEEDLADLLAADANFQSGQPTP